MAGLMASKETRVQNTAEPPLTLHLIRRSQGEWLRTTHPEVPEEVGWHCTRMAHKNAHLGVWEIGSLSRFGTASGKEGNLCFGGKAIDFLSENSKYKHVVLELDRGKKGIWTIAVSWKDPGMVRALSKKFCKIVRKSGGSLEPLITCEDWSIFKSDVA